MSVVVIDAAVRWNLSWSNRPELEFLLPEVEGYPYASPLPDELVWSRVRPKPGASGAFYLARSAPMTRFLYESPGGGGALGTSGLLDDGTRFRTKGGWSTNAGQLNLLREQDEKVAGLLPEPLVEVTYRRKSWAALAMAGLGWDLSFCEEQVERFLPGVQLYPIMAASDLMASAEQSQIVGGGQAPFYVPYPADVGPSGKPLLTSDLYQSTAEEVKVVQAQRERYAPKQ